MSYQCLTNKIQVTFTAENINGIIPAPNSDSQYPGWVGYICPPVDNGNPLTNQYQVTPCNNKSCYNITFKQGGNYKVRFAANIIYNENFENIKITRIIYLLTSITLSDSKISNQISYINSYPYGEPGVGQATFPFLETNVISVNANDTYSFSFEVNVDGNGVPSDDLGYLLEGLEITIIPTHS